MKLVISLFIISYSSFACELKTKNDYVVLSAPISILMKELGVIDNVRLISAFHPYKEKVKKISGGIFLRADKINLKKNTVLFFDESKELERNFKESKVEKIVIRTRNLSSIESTKYLLKKIAPFLVACKKEVKNIERMLKKVKERIEETNFKNIHLFYLGEIRKGLKNNSMLITNDGFILDLKKNRDFKTYPSNSAYTSWSSKVLKRLKGKRSYGLKNSSFKKVSLIKKNYINIEYPGLLIPGYSQVEFLNFFLESI